MMKFFNRIRRKLAAENKVMAYMRYAIGEIVLVMVGILLALQVNNWNISRVDRTAELKYLRNIKVDLTKDIESLKFNIDYRNKRFTSGKKIIDQINGSPVENLDELSFNVMQMVWEERFQPNNITYKEMVSSGNLNLIENDTIKQLLLELESLYQTNSFWIDHETFDYREYISKPVFKQIDIEKLKPIFLGEKTAAEQNIKLESFHKLFSDLEFKNGCLIIYWSAEDEIKLYKDIESKSLKVIELINLELEK